MFIAAFFAGIWVLAAWQNRQRQAFQDAHTFYELTDCRAICWQPGFEPDSIPVRSCDRAEVVRV